MRRLAALVTASALATAGLAAGTAAAAPAAPSPSDLAAGPTVYVGEVSPAQLELVGAAGIAREDLRTSGGVVAGRTSVEVVLDRGAAAKLAALGVPLSEKRVEGQPATQRLDAETTEGYEVFRPYGGPGGLQEELLATARDNPRLATAVTIGRSVGGQDITAVRVTRNDRHRRHGSRPAVLYVSAQHAREWITPEMTRRLLHHVLDGYATDRGIRRIVDTTELWFVPVANPDGYDFTFTEGNRLWRKNLRDNDGDGVITSGDGVDPNRNWPTRWGYDDEGSSPSPASEVYRGPAPVSEPETRALDGLLDRVRFTHMVNYHSAAELLLYGTGWQVATPTPDDLVYEAMLGDDAEPAVEGYDPDISAELYTTNGDTAEHAHTAYGTLAITPEMSTCETVSAADPDDAFAPEDCVSVFNFPDSEPLVQAEFEKNVPLALAVARSARTPDRPVSVVGRTTPDLVVDAFDVSYGERQPVAVTARRSLRDVRLHWSVDGDDVRTARTREWRGGERYGAEGDTWYAELRGTVRGAEPGDEVEVWFTARGRGPSSHGGGSRVESEHVTYTVAGEASDVLVLANEDYEGVNPDYPPGVTAPKYAATYVEALADAGLEATLWDVSADGVPHDLGVLSHFDAVVWYLGDNRLTQDPEDAVTETPIGALPDLAVAERQQDLTLAVRDYLNAGGKLALSGETAGYHGLLGTVLGGIYYGLDGAPEQDCAITVDFFSDCLILSDDFTQYYLGAFARSASEGPTGFVGTDDPLAGVTAAFGGPATVDNPLDEAGSFTVTSGLLPEDEFPQFSSRGAGSYVTSGAAGPFEPVEGDWYVAGLHADNSYLRATRTVDLTGVPASAVPTLRLALSYDTEESYDNVLLEARTVGGEDWTTLPEAGGLSDTGVPADCEVGFLLDEHPFLEHYLSPGDPCTSGGTSGDWNRMTGSSGGWQQAAFDLSAYAGGQVEVSLAYVTDPGAGGVGVFVDDTRVDVAGQPTLAEGFEAGLGDWSLGPPPPGSPPATRGFLRAQTLVAASVSTPDSVVLGFGAEQVADPAERSALLGRAVSGLIEGR